MKLPVTVIVLALTLTACQTSPYLWNDTEFSDQHVAWTWTSDGGPVSARQAQALADTHCKKFGKKAAKEPFETMGFTASERTYEILRQRQFAMYKYFSHQPNVKNQSYMHEHMAGSPAGRQAGRGLDRLYDCL